MSYARLSREFLWACGPPIEMKVPCYGSLIQTGHPQLSREYFGDPECPGIGRIWKLQRKHEDRLQLVEDYVYQMTLRPNPGRHRQVGRDNENATGTTCLAG